MKLSPNFTLEELCFSQTAIRLGIENNPNAEALENLKRLCNDVLEPLRAYLNKPIVITSGYRCLRLNKAIGSKDSSHHTKGLAADIRVIGLSPDQVMRAVVQSGIEYQQVILEFNSWVHISIPALGKPAKKEKLIIDSSGVRFYE